MTFFDVGNAAFEFGGGFILLLNVVKIYRDKEVKGVHWAPTAFFFSWAVWNLFYYPSLGQWWSFTAGVWLGLVNLAWLSLMLLYLGRARRANRENPVTQRNRILARFWGIAGKSGPPPIIRSPERTGASPRASGGKDDPSYAPDQKAVEGP